VRRLRTCLTVSVAAITVVLALSGQQAFASSVRHVVILYQENHSFDDVLGRVCGGKLLCDGARSGRLPDGTTIPLQTATDIVPEVNHDGLSQAMATDGGRMDGFAKLKGCTAADDYRCYSQYAPSQIPNLSRLAKGFTVSDRTFEMHLIPSWGAHLELVAQQLDGFLAATHPLPTGPNPGSGWGCDSQKDTRWAAAPGDTPILVPSCVPDPSLDPTAFPFGGAYRQTPVPHVPTIMDELDASGLSWKIYGGAPGSVGYGWAICPTFADCLYTAEDRNAVKGNRVLTDAANGALPAFSVVIPEPTTSQHNNYSMRQGDNWIGSVVSAIEQGPDWRSTAIFITYDDCGCFYDHVKPPAGLGIRVPMVIVSPWAKRRFVDSRVASFSSMLAFTEHTFGLRPLSNRDANAYDYSNAFNFQQRPLSPVPMTHTRLSGKSRAAVRDNPVNPSGDT